MFQHLDVFHKEDLIVLNNILRILKKGEQHRSYLPYLTSITGTFNHPLVELYISEILISSSPYQYESIYKVSLASPRNFHLRIVIQKVIIKCVINRVARTYFRFIFVTRFKIPNT
jgi:hypothetical protein